MAAFLGTLAASTFIATVSAATAAGATTASVTSAAVIAVGATTASWAIREIVEDRADKGGGAGSGVPTGQETQVIGGARVAQSTLGRDKLTDQDYLLAYVNTHDLGDDRIAVNIIHVLSEGAIEGVERIWIDDYLAMEAPKDRHGNYVLDGSIQVMEPPLTGPDRYDNDTVKTWQEVYQSARDAGRTEDEAIDDLDSTDFLRFRAIQRVRRKNGGARGTNPIRLHGGTSGSTDDDVFLADWGPWAKAWVYPADGFVKSDGTIEKTYQTASKLIDDPEWKSDEYMFRGKAIVHLQLERSNFDSPFSGSLPRVEYQVKGRRISWPQADGSLNSPTWTENAAAVRYWFHTELEDVPADVIDLAEFREAYDYCQQNVIFRTTNPELADYTTTVRRYTTNMTFLQDPNYYDQYRQEQDVAWQGYVIESRGEMLFRPGRPRVPAFDIGPHNTVQTLTFMPQAPENDRVNALRATVTRSLDNDFESVDLPVVEDTAAIQHDGELYERTLQTLRAIKYPVNALNIVHIQLRRARASGRLTKIIQLDPVDFEGNTYAPINCLDRVRVTDPTLGLVNALYEVVSWQRNDNFTISVDLKESPDGIYSALLEIPNIPRQRRLNLPDATARPFPVRSLVATPSVTIGNDGTLQLGINVTWDVNQNATEISVLDANGIEVAEGSAQAGHGFLELSVLAEGAYLVNAVHINEVNRRSQVASVSVTVDASNIVPPAPVLRTAETGDDHITFFFEPFPAGNLNVSGLEFRYRVKNLDSTDAFPAAPMTDADFRALPSLTRGPVAPVFGIDGFTSVVQVPFGGRYRIYCRSVTRDERVSAIVELPEDFLIAGLRARAGTVNFHPQWEGTLGNTGRLWISTYSDGGVVYNTRNLLVRDRPTASAVTFRSWDGLDGWPFGVSNPSTYLVNPAIDFGATGNWEVRYEIDTWGPAQTNHTWQIFFQGRVNGVAVGNPAQPPGENQWLRLTNVNEAQLQLNITSAGTAIRGLTVNFRAVT